MIQYLLLLIVPGTSTRTELTSKLLFMLFQKISSLSARAPWTDNEGRNALPTCYKSHPCGATYTRFFFLIETRPCNEAALATN